MPNLPQTLSTDRFQLQNVRGKFLLSGMGINLVELLILLLMGALTLSSITSYQALIPLGIVVIAIFLRIVFSRATSCMTKSEGVFRSVIGGLRISNIESRAAEFLPISHWCVLGFLLPIASIFPKGGLTLSVIATLLVDHLGKFSGGACTDDNPRPIGRSVSPLVVFTPFLLLCSGWIGFAAFHEFPVFYIGKTLGLLSAYPISFFSLSKLAPVTVSLIDSITPMVLMLMVWGRLATMPSKIGAMLGGLVVSWIIALCWALLQAFGFTALPQRRNGDFWLKQGRFWGTFSDPNAFGVFSIIFVSLLTSFKLRHITKYPLVIMSILIPLISGSRSFIIGLALLGCIWVIEKRALIAAEVRLRTCRPHLIKILILGALLIFSFVAVLQPSGLHRLLLSLNPETAAEAFFSRAVFWRSCVWIWLQNPWIGGGLSSFRDNFPLAVDHFGWELNGWIDNANNFYLGLFAELGLFGSVLFCLSLVRLKWSPECSLPSARAPLVISAVLLFFGPHLEFLEVAILVGLVLAKSVEARGVDIAASRYSWLCGLGLAMVGLVLIATSDKERDYGVFTPVKRSVGAGITEKPIWLSPKASLVRPCKGGLINLRVTDERSDGARLNPYFGGDGSLNKITLATAKDRVEVQLLNSSAMVALECSGETSRVSVISSTPWIPRLSRGGNDSRFLGVKVTQQMQGRLK